MSEAGKSDIDLYVADRVKHFRKAQKLSLKKLGEILNVSQAFLGQIEDPKHRARYNVMHLNQLAIIFRCSPKDFLPDSPIGESKLS